VCTRLAAASDKVYELLAQGRLFSPGTPASSTTKTGRHDIAEILLKVVLNTKIQIQILSLLGSVLSIKTTNIKLYKHETISTVILNKNNMLSIAFIFKSSLAKF